jgi:hypothetical protein
MDLDRFDGFTRQLSGAGSSRRHVARALGSLLLGGSLTGVAARLGLTEGTEAKPQRHHAKPRRQDRAQPQAGGLHTAGKGKHKKKRKHKQQCNELTAPLCQDCQKPRCNTATGEWTCQNACRSGFTCCNGLCEPNCDNGCTTNPNNACICETPKNSGQVYCAAEHLCAANPCQSGQEYDSRTCECHDQDPQLCAVGWEWCNGACRDATFSPWTTCGNTCCRNDEECCNGKCVAKQFGPYTPCGDTCCADKTSQCCNGQCWPKDLGTWAQCGDICCRSEYDQCCGNSCCAKEAVCCSGGDRCCPHGYTCGADGCHRV